TVNVDQKNQVIDVEDFVELGKKHRFCPYFKYREKSDVADLILMPYNYILDPRTLKFKYLDFLIVRKANKINLNDSILIIDEAHNLEKVCEESASVSFSTKDLAGCQKEAKQALATILAEEEELRKAMDETDVGFGKSDSQNQFSSLNNLNLDTKELAHFIVLLESLEKEIDKINYENLKGENAGRMQNLDGKVLNGSFLYDLLTKSEF
uniref:Helicase ATP-binding domain-containing protein n=1 Tax=Romanomermis culicivorax TaxID=13658 RepID=A0A915JCH2_ROMCU